MKKLLLPALLLSALSANTFAADISAYEYAPLKDTQSVKTTLTQNGLEVIGEYDAMNDKKYHVIVYTDATLKKMASKKDRAFAAVQKVLVDTKDNMLVFTNPNYFLHAFLQDDFNEKSAHTLNEKIKAAFKVSKGSSDKLDDDDIAGYHFMMSMPYYEDMITVAEGKNLLQKLEKNAGKNIVFKLALNSNTTLVGVAMPTKDGEASYIPTIKAEQKAAFLPYMVLIENNEAKILHPKYYLAIAAPQLSMGDFTKIMGTPGDIEDYFSAFFK